MDATRDGGPWRFRACVLVQSNISLMLLHRWDRTLARRSRSAARPSPKTKTETPPPPPPTTSSRGRPTQRRGRSRASGRRRGPVPRPRASTRPEAGVLPHPPGPPAEERHAHARRTCSAPRDSCRASHRFGYTRAAPSNLAVRRPPSPPRRRLPACLPACRADADGPRGRRSATPLRCLRRRSPAGVAVAVARSLCANTLRHDSRSARRPPITAPPDIRHLPAPLPR